MSAIAKPNHQWGLQSNQITLTAAANPFIVAKTYRTGPDQAENAIYELYGVDGDVKFKLEIIA